MSWSWRVVVWALWSFVANVGCDDTDSANSALAGAAGEKDSGDERPLDAAVSDAAPSDAAPSDASQPDAALVPDAGPDDGDAGEPDSGPPIEGACDQDTLDATYDDDGDPETPAQSVDEIAAACAPDCMVGGGTDGCVRDCVTQRTGGAVSPDCAMCFEQAVYCGVRNCLGDCFGAEDSPRCRSCGCRECAPALGACAGVSIEECGDH